jgi:hypothetical protein
MRGCWGLDRLSVSLRLAWLVEGKVWDVFEVLDVVGHHGEAVF